MRWACLAGFVSILALAAPAAAQPHGHHGQGEGRTASTGQVAMRTMGNAAAQAPFLEGLAHLHNFEYGRAVPAFRAAQQADPDFVMAYWGEAMTYNHPLWAEQDADAARAVLQRLGSDPEARLAKARSPREAEWLKAVEILYGDGSKRDRDRRYSEQMRRLHESDPADVDARAFYALSILGTADGGRDAATYMRSGAILEEAFPSNPSHPGILHYLIHSYDDVVHAPLGLRAARLYGAIAPDAAHAQHMTSHIYLALGMWDESIASNKAAMAATDKVLAAAGKEPTLCGHYPEWLAYSQNQRGLTAEAEAIVTGCRREAEAELRSGRAMSSAGGARSLFNNWAIIAARHGVDTGRWQDSGWIPAGDHGKLGRFWLAYADMHKARAAGEDVQAAAARLDALGKEVLAALKAERPYDMGTPRWVERAMIQSAILGRARGPGRAGAIAELKQAAEAEAALPVEFGPPPIPKPSWELAGDLALESGDRAGAAEAYRRSLAAAPGRRLSVEGLAKATR